MVITASGDRRVTDWPSLCAAEAVAPPPSRTSTLGANKNKTSAPPAPNPTGKGSAPAMIPRKSETSQVALSKSSRGRGAKPAAWSSCDPLCFELPKVARPRVLV